MALTELALGKMRRELKHMHSHHNKDWTPEFSRYTSLNNEQLGYVCARQEVEIEELKKTITIMAPRLVWAEQNIEYLTAAVNTLMRDTTGNGISSFETDLDGVDILAFDPYHGE